mgnify:CR=1 FL=1
MRSDSIFAYRLGCSCKESTKQANLVFLISIIIYESDAMLFKKIAIAAAVATTLAFVGCAKKTEEAAPNTEAAASQVEAAASAVEASADDAASAASAAADSAADAASTADAAASTVDAAAASAAQ